MMALSPTEERTTTFLKTWATTNPQFFDCPRHWEALMNMADKHTNLNLNYDNLNWMVAQLKKHGVDLSKAAHDQREADKKFREEDDKRLQAKLKEDQARARAAEEKHRRDNDPVVLAARQAEAERTKQAALEADEKWQLANDWVVAKQESQNNLVQLQVVAARREARARAKFPRPEPSKDVHPSTMRNTELHLKGGSPVQIIGTPGNQYKLPRT
jgi:hypothetical protein